MAARTKSLDHQVKEYIKKEFSDDDLKHIGERLSQRLGGDLGDALIFIQDNHPELHKVLSSASSCDEVYNIVDLIDKHIQEFSKKFLVTK